MVRLRAWFTGALLLVGCLTQAAPSFADKPPSASGAASAPSDGESDGALAPKLELDGPEAEAKDQARALFEQGVEAYRAGKFYDAVRIFLQTERVYPDAQLTFNVARTYENLGNNSAALRYYRDYLRETDRPSDGDEVRERVRKLEQELSERGVQQLTVLSKPDSATVLLDGQPVGITPWTGETYPGKHRLGLTRQGYLTQEQVIDVDAYEARDITLELHAEPKPLPPAPTIVIAKPKRSAVSLGTLVTLSSGIALLGLAVVAEATSHEAGISPAGAFFAGGGLGVGSVGGVMLYFDLAPQGSLRAAPSSGKDSAALRP